MRHSQSDTAKFIIDEEHGDRREQNFLEDDSNYRAFVYSIVVQTTTDEQDSKMLCASVTLLTINSKQLRCLWSIKDIYGVGDKQSFETLGDTIGELNKNNITNLSTLYRFRCKTLGPTEQFYS